MNPWYELFITLFVYFTLFIGVVWCIIILIKDKIKKIAICFKHCSRFYCLWGRWGESQCYEQYKLFLYPFWMGITKGEYEC